MSADHSPIFRCWVMPRDRRVGSSPYSRSIFFDLRRPYRSFHVRVRDNQSQAYQVSNFEYSRALTKRGYDLN